MLALQFMVAYSYDDDDKKIVNKEPHEAGTLAITLGSFSNLPIY